jgi:hypothetical protein
MLSGEPAFLQAMAIHFSLGTLTVKTLSGVADIIAALHVPK